jgi:glycosyltransferase involved in cell wall biosynthesis
MHIVIANQWYPPESGCGGVAMWNHAMAHAYRDLGHRVSVITSRASEKILADSEIDEIHVLRLLARDAYRMRRMPGIGRYVRPVHQLLYSARLKHALDKLDESDPFDVVEFAEVNAEGFFYTRVPLTAVVVRCHTPTFVLARYYTAREMPYDTNIISRCEKDLIRRAHAVTAPSHQMASIISEETEVPIDQIAVVPNAIDHEPFQGTEEPTNQTHNALTILFVGRLERAKGVTVIADAIAPVLDAVPDARFVFIGNDRNTRNGASQRTELERRFAKAKIDSRVEFLGGVNQSTLLKWYHRADICVVPSLLYESYSYTCAQAMAAGKPVVASRIGGISETVDDGVNGILCEPGNVSQFVDSMIRLATDSDLRATMGRAGREKVAREFDPIKIAKRNLEVYERAKRTFQRSVD